MPERAVQTADVREIKVDSRINFRNPNFKIHPSCIPFTKPLSRLAKLSENRDRQLEVLAIVLNPAGDVLLLDGSNATLPQGPVEFGTDQTILESAVRVVRSQTGVRVSGIRTLVGIYSPPADPEGSKAPRKRVYAFLATATPAEPGFSSAKKPHVFRSMEDIDKEAATLGDRSCLRAARDYMSRRPDRASGSGPSKPKELIGIPPTRIVKPTFNVAGELKAYLLPIEVFSGLPINKGRLVSAGAVILHPEPERKILLLQRSNSSHWQLPSSLVQPEDESLSIVHVAGRAVKSTTGLDTQAVRGFVGSFEREQSVTANGEKTMEKRYLFMIKPVDQGGQLEVKVDEHRYKGFKWVGTEKDLAGMTLRAEESVVVDHMLEALAKGKDGDKQA